MDLRPIAFVTGVLLVILAATMLIPAAFDFFAGLSTWRGFMISAGFTAFLGSAMAMSTQAQNEHLSVRQAFVMTTSIWLSIAIFGTLPFLLVVPDIGLANAFFESMSGITTTGSTVMTGLDTTDRGILVWRSLLQWLGGVGIIVMALSILPMLGVGGMQLFRSEAFEQSEKLLPRATEIAFSLLQIYSVLTLATFVALWITGMTPFDAFIHALTSISTGGFSSHDASLGYQPYQTAGIQLTIIVAMIAGSLPFMLYLKSARGVWRGWLSEPQIPAFFGILAVVILVMSIWQWRMGSGIGESLLSSSFNVISIMTGTGYSSADYSAWGPFANATFLILMFLGGCAGSTTCGVKIFRFQVLLSTSLAQLRRLASPRSVIVPHYGRKAITEDIAESVQVFFYLFILTFAGLSLALGFCGLDFITAISAAATAITNVGPGLGETVGPSGTFQSLPDAAKWIMSIGMLLGRLELFTIFALFVPALWQD